MPDLPRNEDIVAEPVASAERTPTTPPIEPGKQVLQVIRGNIDVIIVQLLDQVNRTLGEILTELRKEK